jgi:carbon starvation protein
MLLEGFVAIISLATVMILPAQAGGSPDRIFAEGVSTFIARLASALGIDFQLAQAYLINFSLLAFATFIYDTLDVCTRLGRYVLQEFTGWRGQLGRYVCTALTLVPPMYLILQNITDPVSGAPVPAWKVFWTLFGTANQLLAALTLLGVTVWLARTGKTWWYTAIPAVFMMGVTLTSLSMILYRWATHLSKTSALDPNGPLSIVLLALAVLLIVEAVIIMDRIVRGRSAAVA